jgi:competence protein ComEC
MNHTHTHKASDSQRAKKVLVRLLPICALVCLVVALPCASELTAVPAKGATRPPATSLLATPASPNARSMKSARAANRNDLRIYFIDVEGGQSTLFVTPAGESLLVDTGWPDNSGRDADRILAAARNAGISKIDYAVITHYHVDHVGGVPQLVARIRVGTFIDHGPLRESDPATVQVHAAYEKVLATGKYKHKVARPGEILPIRGMRMEVVSADGEVIDKPLPGAGQSNASACAASPKYSADETENRRSVGMVITFGTLRILDLGDLTHDEEVKLMCPVNKLGKINVLVVSHHGWDQSSSPALVWGIAPRVAIMDNGAKKGGTPSVWDIIEKSPGLETLWQLHYSDEGGKAHNVVPEYIANLDGPDAGNYIELTADPSGSFKVFNSRTRKSKEYPAQ